MVFFRRNVSLFIILMAGLVNCDPVKYTDCGPNNIQSVKITPCDNEAQCTLLLGTYGDVEVEFVSPVDTTEVSQLIKGVVRGKVLVIPYKKENACELGYLNPKCPIKKGEKYAFNAKMEIKSFYPAIPIQIQYLLLDTSQNTIFCAQIGGIIKDGGPKKARRRGKS